MQIFATRVSNICVSTCNGLHPEKITYICIRICLLEGIILCFSGHLSESFGHKNWAENTIRRRFWRIWSVMTLPSKGIFCTKAPECAMNFSRFGKETAEIQVSFCKPSLYFCNVMSLMACTISEDLFPLALWLVIRALRI